MEIIKHGYLEPRYFACEVCGCEFVATMKEYTRASEDEFFLIGCPECDRLIMADAPLYNEKEEDDEEELIRLAQAALAELFEPVDTCAPTLLDPVYFELLANELEGLDG